MGAQRALVVGAGSIGLRHRSVLESMDVACAVVTRRATIEDAKGTVFHDIRAAVDEWRPTYVVVATETTDHRQAIERLAGAGFTGVVLVEKPIGDCPAPVPEHHFADLRVAYQLRFHPAVLAARDALADRPVLAVDSAVGQHLADWRPGRPLGQTASAKVAMGGGALRDLSHELDLVLWLAGDWERVAAVGGRSGSLGSAVDTDDRWAIIIELVGGAVATVHLDALDHVGRRRMTIVASDRTCALDLVAGSLVVGGTRPLQRTEAMAGRDAVIAAMHHSVMAGQRLACTTDEAEDVVGLISAIERAALERRWVDRHEM